MEDGGNPNQGGVPGSIGILEKQSRRAIKSRPGRFCFVCISHALSRGPAGPGMAGLLNRPANQSLRTSPFTAAGSSFENP